MKILINNDCCGYIKTIISRLERIIGGPSQVVAVISNKPVPCIDGHSKNYIVDKKLLVNTLEIPDISSDLEIYIANSYSLLAVLENNVFDILLGDTLLKISYKYKISCSIHTEYLVSVNDKTTQSFKKTSFADHYFRREFKKLVQSADSEPAAKSLGAQIIELREELIKIVPLEAQIVELRTELNKTIQLVESKTETNSLETQIAELREMVYAYFPIREMEKLKLKVAELESTNSELISENAKLKKSIESEKAKSEEVYLAKQEWKNKELADLLDKINQLLAE